MRYFWVCCASLFILACSGRSVAPETEPAGESERSPAMEQEEEGNSEGPARDLEVDELVGRGTRTPFGLALDVTVDEATLLYPTLVAFGVPSSDLAKHLPATVGGRARGTVVHGVQEGLDAAWVGAIAQYDGDGGPYWLMIQDAGWEPTTLNPLHEGWRSGSQDPLSDGRPVSDVPPPEGDGVFFQAPVATAGAHRLVVHAHGPEGADEGMLRSLLESVPAAPLRALEVASTGRSGPYPVSSRLPGGDVLAPLAEPAALAKALPGAGQAGWTQVAEGWGWRREASRNILTGAWRVFQTPHGVLVASAQDLGDPERPVVLDWKGGGESGGTADEIRSALRKSGKTGCSDFFASCKWGRLVDDRVILSVFGPMGDGNDAMVGLGAQFDGAAAADAVKGR